MTDLQLHSRFRAGEESAVRDVYERYGGAMFATAMSVLGNRDLAADAVQQAFVKAWRGVAHLRSRARAATVARDHHGAARPSTCTGEN